MKHYEFYIIISFFISLPLFSCDQSETGKSFGEVKVDLSGVNGNLNLAWLNISDSNWFDDSPVSGGNKITMKAPASGQWVVNLKKQ